LQQPSSKPSRGGEASCYGDATLGSYYWVGRCSARRLPQASPMRRPPPRRLHHERRDRPTAAWRLASAAVAPAAATKLRIRPDAICGLLPSLHPAATKLQFGSASVCMRYYAAARCIGYSLQWLC